MKKAVWVASVLLLVLFSSSASFAVGGNPEDEVTEIECYKNLMDTNIVISVSRNLLDDSRTLLVEMYNKKSKMISSQAYGIQETVISYKDSGLTQPQFVTYQAPSMLDIDEVFESLTTDIMTKTCSLDQFITLTLPARKNTDGGALLGKDYEDEKLFRNLNCSFNESFEKLPNVQKQTLK